MSNENTCQKYTEEKSYDLCKLKALENFFKSITGCSVPYIHSNTSVCTNETLKEEVWYMELEHPKNKISIFKAQHAFDNVAAVGESCKEPCVKTVTFFGFPFLTEEDIDYAYAKLYFKNIVKVTEDYLAYSFLRFFDYR